MTNALELYESSLELASADADAGVHSCALVARLPDGTTFALPLDRWLGGVNATDVAVLGRCRGPVLDVGCGPGRHVHSLARAGVLALGVDISPAAVALTRSRGARALQASVFDQLPGARTWRTALLLDGNVGIGGCPPDLLRRVSTLLSDDGEVLIEVEPPGAQTFACAVRLEGCGAQMSDWFDWARVGIDGAEDLARRASLRVLERWQGEGRWFVRMGQA